MTKPTCYVQENGLRVVLLPQHTAPVVAMDVWVGVGAADEQVHEVGLAHVHEHMLFKGSAKFGVGEIARTIEAAGGEVNAWTNHEQTVYHAQMSSRFMEVGLSVLADAVQYPLFDSEELARELEVIQEEIRRSDDSPGATAQKQFFATAYKQHPYGRPVIGWPEQVAGFKAPDVRAFFDRWYQPHNMTVVVVGDIDPEQTKAMIAQHFNRPKAQIVHPKPARAVEVIGDGPRAVVGTADMREHYLMLGFAIPGFDAQHLRDVVALDVLALVLGGSESARLHVQLCRRLGLVNAVSASAYTPANPGQMMFSAVYQDPNVTLQVLDALSRAAFDTRHNVLTADELERAKTLLMSNMVYEKQTMQGQAHKLGFYDRTFESFALEAAYYAAIDGLTVEDLREVAVQYLELGRVTVSLLAPVESVAAKLEAEELTQQLRDSAGAVAVAAAEAAKPVVLRLQGGKNPDDRAQMMTLSNGLRLLVQTDDSAPLVAIRAVFPGGRKREPEDRAGLSFLMSGLLTRGTQHQTADEISAASERIAGHIGGASGQSTMGLSGIFLSKHAAAGFKLFSDCLWRPTFPDEEVRRERELLLEDISARPDDLAGTAFRQLMAGLYGDHPSAIPLTGSAESVGAVQPLDLREAHGQWARPSQMIICAVGDIQAESVARLLEQYASGVESAPTMAPPQEPPKKPGSTLIRSIAPKQQAHIAIGFLTPGLGHPDRAALDLTSTLLSGQGGRLFLELRDRQSLAYSVSTLHRPDMESGYFAFYIATSPDKVAQALRGIRREIDRLQEGAVSADELERARRYLIGAYDISLQRAGARANLMAMHEFLGLGHSHYLAYTRALEAVEPQRLCDAARQHFDMQHVVLSAVHSEGTEVSLEMLM